MKRGNHKEDLLLVHFIHLVRGTLILLSPWSSQWIFYADQKSSPHQACSNSRNILSETSNSIVLPKITEKVWVNLIWISDLNTFPLKDGQSNSNTTKPLIQWICGSEFIQGVVIISFVTTASTQRSDLRLCFAQVQKWLSSPMVSGFGKFLIWVTNYLERLLCFYYRTIPIILREKHAIAVELSTHAMNVHKSASSVLNLCI